MLVQHTGANSLFAADGPVGKSRIKIIINETSLVKGSHVFLGDISDIDATGFLKEALEKIDLGISPKPDKIKSFNKKKIVAVIGRQRYLPENITITSPQRIYVKRASQTISKQDIRQLTDTRLSIVLKNKDYQLTAFSVRGLEPYPQGKIKFYVDSNEIINKKGKLSFFLDVIIDGKKQDRVSVSGMVAVYENILHTARSFAKGETISSKNVFWAKKNIFEISDNYIKTFKEIDQMILKSGIRKNDYLKSSLFSEPPLVQKGDIITLISKNKNLLIVTSAICKEDGFENGLIKVENLNTGKLVRGIVRGKSKVEVVY
jgi:flagella basal body P-ring formation protein FlgA